VRVAIFDLQLANYYLSSIPYPSGVGMLIAGYHKAKKDLVVLFDKPFNFKQYDIVYLLRDWRNIWYDPVWANLRNVKLVGRYWSKEEQFYQSFWEKYTPDILIYQKWLENRIKENPWLPTYRYKHFYKIPIKLRQLGNLNQPEGKDFLIIDWDIEEWDPDYEYLINLNIEKAFLLYPQKANNRWQQISKLFFSKGLIIRKGLIAEHEGIMDREERDSFLKWTKHYKVNNSIRIKNYLTCNSEEEWIENFIITLDMFSEFITKNKIKILLHYEGHKETQIGFLMDAANSWSIVNVANSKNTLFDFILISTFESYKRILQFLQDPASELVADTTRLILIFKKYRFLIPIIMRNQFEWGKYDT